MMKLCEQVLNQRIVGEAAYLNIFAMMISLEIFFVIFPLSPANCHNYNFFSCYQLRIRL